MRLLALQAVWWLATFTHERVMDREGARVTPICDPSPDGLGWLPMRSRRLCRDLEGLWTEVMEVRVAAWRGEAEKCLRARGLMVYRCPVCERRTDRLEEVARFKGPRFAKGPVIVKVTEPYPEMELKREIERLVACRPCGAAWYQEWLDG